MLKASTYSNHSRNSEDWFTYETRPVATLSTSDRTLIDSENVESRLEGADEENRDRQALPVNNLAGALGLEGIQLSIDEIVFKPRGNDEIGRRHLY